MVSLSCSYIIQLDSRLCLSRNEVIPINKLFVKKVITLWLLASALAFSGFLTAQETQTPADDIRTATVKEMQIAGSYVYLLVVEDDKEFWLATSPGFVKDIKYGDVIEFRSDMEMQDFHSNALDRTFASLWFVAQIRVVQDNVTEGSAEEAPPPGQ